MAAGKADAADAAAERLKRLVARWQGSTGAHYARGQEHRIAWEDHLKLVADENENAEKKKASPEIEVKPAVPSPGDKSLGAKDNSNSFLAPHPPSKPSAT
jgi:hypothetical protein